MTMAGSEPIDGSTHFISGRDIDIRIDYLAFLEDPDEPLSEDDQFLWADEIEELAKLKELWSTLNNDLYADLIHEDAFRGYSDQYADELYELDGNGASAYFAYDRFADDYESEFSTVEFDGATYYSRDH